MSQETVQPGGTLEPGVAYYPRRQVLSVAHPNRMTPKDRAARARIVAQRTYVLALDESHILERHGGTVRVTMVREPMVPSYDLPTETLCVKLNTTVEKLDKIADVWFQPDKSEPPEGARRKKDGAELWRLFRQVTTSPPARRAV